MTAAFQTLTVQLGDRQIQVHAFTANFVIVAELLDVPAAQIDVALSHLVWV